MHYGGEAVQRVIYADVLIFVNAVMTLLILLTSSDITRLYPKDKRYILGACVGGIGSLFALLTELNIVLSIVIKVLQCLLIVFFVFGFGRPKIFIKAVLGFLLSSFLYGGIVFFIRYFFLPDYIYISNGYVYFDIGAFGLIFVSVGVFVAFKLADRKIFKKTAKDIIYDVVLYFPEKRIECRALLDSGNNVTDYYTGRPVIILSLSEVVGIFPEGDYQRIRNIINGDISAQIPQGIRLLPVKTLGVMKMLPTVTAQKAVVSNADFRKTVNKPSVVLSGESFDKEKYSALINSNITGQVL